MITVVIPTYLEAGTIATTLQDLRRADADGLVRQVVVADAGSPDGTAAVALAAGADVIVCPERGRALQMNAGAARATQPVLYFLHADTVPPARFSAAIRDAVAAGVPAGCFRLRFGDPHPFLRFCAWFTRWNVDAVRFGDQSLYATRDLFERVGGFRSDLQVMEDQEVVTRLRRSARFRVLPHSVTTSARKYRRHGVYRTQAVFTLVFSLYYLGVPQRWLTRVYRSLLE